VRPAAAGLRDGDDLAVRRAGRSQPRRLLLAAAAAAVVVVVGVVGLLGRGGGGEDGDVLAAARTAAEAPGAAVGTLGSGDVGGDVVARVVADGDEAYVLDDGLADLPDGRTYQLWRLDGGRATSIGLLDPDDGATAIDAQSPDARLAITEEPSGGSPAPTGPVVATGTFPA
jgi:anti-sigma-K factor RskA